MAEFFAVLSAALEHIALGRQLRFEASRWVIRGSRLLPTYGTAPLQSGFPPDLWRLSRAERISELVIPNHNIEL